MGGASRAYTLDEMRDEATCGEWDEATSDGKSSMTEAKDGVLDEC